MATRAEMSKAEAQRKGRRAASEARAPIDEDAIATHASARAAAKATYAHEAPAADGRRSRKSTRASRNRAKPDAQLNAREGMQKGSPTARYRKSAARAARVRGA